MKESVVAQEHRCADATEKTVGGEGQCGQGCPLQGGPAGPGFEIDKELSALPGPAHGGLEPGLGRRGPRRLRSVMFAPATWLCAKFL